MERIAITYRRVSTDRQAKEGVSLAAQVESVKAYCTMRGWSVAKHFQDAGKSGKSRAGRPGLEAAIAMACERKGVIVAYSLSRLARSVIDASTILGELRAAGADLAVVDMAMDTSTPSGELIFNIFSALAQFESQQIGDRIKRINAHIVDKRGYRTMGVQPAGWRMVDGRRVRVEEEMAILSRVELLARMLKKPSLVAEDMRLTGTPTIRELRRRREDPEYVCEKGWTAPVVVQLLRSIKKQRAEGLID